MLVVIDEAHLLAPHMAASAHDAKTRRLGVATLTDLCARGRKRGISTVIATQRLAKLAASVVSELHNVLLGLNTVLLAVHARSRLWTSHWSPDAAAATLILRLQQTFVKWKRRA